MATQLQDSSELSLRSEKTQDVMDRMPNWFIRWGTIIILMLILLVFAFSWLIRYPEVVLSEVSITTTNPPLKIVAKSPGNLRLEQISPGQKVSRGQYIAVIENSANARDVVALREKLIAFKANYEEVNSAGLDFFPESLSLGSLQILFSDFLKTYQEIILVDKLNRNGSQLTFLHQQISNYKKLLNKKETLIRVKKEELSIFKKKWERDSQLFMEKVISEEDYEDSKIIFLNKTEDFENFRADMIRVESQILELSNQTHEIQFDDTETLIRLELALWEHYNNLMSAITDWEQTYVLKAPIDGTLEFLDFWKDNEFVKSGEEVFSIIPDNAGLTGHAEMPTHGAGKVELGQRVMINLEDYPYKEFGTVHGVVESISPLTKEEVTLLGKENYYLITISLPNGLKTNFNKSLEFKHDMVGMGEVVTNERNLLERIFENIVYIFNQ
ncbi:multidrug resistance efflux pump [Catalinimonas alkaloidigena]|uniref:HlyD family efflux transporter periplasmic adaptor subunit n=1 Tax=Catalinimonas alkaloidigena TaxID=1075417 RepID=UPI002405DE14|nr:HlyD family efflux transporter periplasmic adaptor subunit [Catalinimonas alkaloidigena]MDF9799375.1 multidrug resistance efflux pump [Catalinimonas alkaloidigena]